MTTSRNVLASSPDTCSGQISLDYDRAEIRPMASWSIEIAPILVYVIGLVTMLALSPAYNMWPVLPAKWALRRFDHSAPSLAQMKNVLASADLGSRTLAYLQLVSRTRRWLHLPGER
jgi:hypothetical protein